MPRGSSSLPRFPAANERQRRDRMKQLYSNLASLLHLQPYEKIPLPEFLDRAASALVQRKERVEQLNARKEELEKELRIRYRNSHHAHSVQLVRVTEMDSKLEANLIIVASNKKANPFSLLSVIEQGGAQVTSSSFCTVGDLVYCTIYAQEWDYGKAFRGRKFWIHHSVYSLYLINAFQARVGFDITLIESRLLELVYLA